MLLNPLDRWVSIYMAFKFSVKKSFCIISIQFVRFNCVSYWQDKCALHYIGLTAAWFKKWCYKLRQVKTLGENIKLNWKNTMKIFLCFLCEMMAQRLPHLHRLNTKPFCHARKKNKTWQNICNPAKLKSLQSPSLTWWVGRRRLRRRRRRRASRPGRWRPGCTSSSSRWRNRPLQLAIPTWSCPGWGSPLRDSSWCRTPVPACWSRSPWRLGW